MAAFYAREMGCRLCCVLCVCVHSQAVNEAQQSGAAAAAQPEAQQLSKQLAAALCSLAEMHMSQADTVTSVSAWQPLSLMVQGLSALFIL